MTLATQVVTIISLVFAVIVALVGLIVFLIRKQGEVRQAGWQIRVAIRSMDLNMRKGFNRATSCEDEGEVITLQRVIAVLHDEKVLDDLSQNATGLYQSLNEFKVLYDNYMSWGRILRLGDPPKQPDDLPTTSP